MTEQTTAIVTRSAIEDREITYVPMGATEKISLTVGMVIKFLCRPTKQGFVCTTEHAMRFMMLCKARGLNPWEGDAYLVGYDAKDGPEFNLVTAHQAFLKRAEAHPKFDGMESGIVVADDQDVVVDVPGDFLEVGLKLAGGWARVHRSDRKFPTYRRLNLSAFQKPFGVWLSNPQGMIVKCAEADAMRSAFPNSLAGLYVDGEPLHESPSPASAAMVARVNPAAVLAEIIDATPPPTQGQANPLAAEPESVPAPAANPATAARRGRPPKTSTPTAEAGRVPADQMAAEMERFKSSVLDGAMVAARSNVAEGKSQTPAQAPSGPTLPPVASTAATAAGAGNGGSIGGNMFDGVENLDQLSEEEIAQVETWKEKASAANVDAIVGAIGERQTSARRKEKLFCKSMREVLAGRGLNPNGTKIQQQVVDSPAPAAQTAAPAAALPSVPVAPTNEVQKALTPPAETPSAEPAAPAAAPQPAQQNPNPNRPATEFDIESPIQWEEFLRQCKEAAQIELSKTVTDPAKLEKSIADAVKSTASKFPLRHGWVGKAEEKAVSPAGQADMEKAMDLMLSESWNWALAKPL